jgi:hypothetical protein
MLKSIIFSQCAASQFMDLHGAKLGFGNGAPHIVRKVGDKRAQQSRRNVEVQDGKAIGPKCPVANLEIFERHSGPDNQENPSL